MGEASRRCLTSQNLVRGVFGFRGIRFQHSAECWNVIIKIVHKNFEKGLGTNFSFTCPVGSALADSFGISFCLPRSSAEGGWYRRRSFSSFIILFFNTPPAWRIDDILTFP